MPAADRIPARALVASLQRRIDEVLAPLVPRNSEVALLDFPNHSNVGDSAIWAGEVAYLDSRGCRSVYRCDRWNYSRDELARRIGKGIILIHGGGNLGDLWPPHQLFRESIVAGFADNPIIVLPQSIHFQARASLSRARAVFDAHPNLTLLVRDLRSLEIARNEFRAASELCPDMAFCLGVLTPPGPPVADVVCLLRTDIESTAYRRPVETTGVEVTDWLDEPPTAVASLHALLSRQLVRRPRRLARLRRLVDPLATRVARQRVARGCRLLARGRVVVTDRLHAHILSLLLGRRHVFLDNSYGKLSSFVDCWTRDCELTHRSESIEEAMDMAGTLVG